VVPGWSRRHCRVGSLVDIRHLEIAATALQLEPLSIDKLSRGNIVLVNGPGLASLIQMARTSEERRLASLGEGPAHLVSWRPIGPNWKTVEVISREKCSDGSDNDCGSSRSYRVRTCSVSLRVNPKRLNTPKPVSRRLPRREGLLESRCMGKTLYKKKAVADQAGKCYGDFSPTDNKVIHRAVRYLLKARNPISPAAKVLGMTLNDACTCGISARNR
jgi:hypothetical protein